MRGVSKKVERICRSINNQEYHIRTVFKPIYTIRHMLTKVKSKVSDDKKKGLVYEIPCRGCKHVYVGETKITLKRRIVEHKHASSEEMAVHANTHDHRW